jgi:hypothetical protein
MSGRPFHWALEIWRHLSAKMNKYIFTETQIVFQITTLHTKLILLKLTLKIKEKKAIIINYPPTIMLGILN